MRKKYQSIPKPVLKGLANDIENLMHSNQGRILVVEMIEEMPYDLRSTIFEGLSAFYSDKMVAFFHLLNDEYGKEVENICNRALKKYSLAGLDINKKPYFNGRFYKAYASCSRHTGRITLDIAWEIDSKDLHVECFYLTFNSDGVHSFFLIPSMPEEQYNVDREIMSNMVELNESETAFLISEAYQWNLRKMTRPAAGKFLYKKYFNKNELDDEDRKNLICKLSGKLTPRQLVNSFYYAVKQKDYTYLYAICNTMSKSAVKQCCQDLLGLNTAILEGQADEVFANQNNGEVTSSCIIVNDDVCYRLNYRFSLIKLNGFWLIDKINLDNKELIGAEMPCNPFNIQVYCRVYEITDLDELFEILDKIDNIREVDELPYGLHMRVTNEHDDFNYGVSFFSGILADLIINGDEFVVICREHDTLINLHSLLFCTEPSALVLLGEYEVDLVTAYNYVGGSYISFEDVLTVDTDQLAVENDLRFISTRYLVKSHIHVLNVLNNIPNCTCINYDNYSIFYQFDYHDNDKVLLAEYVLGSDWLTVSTFGYTDMNLVRQNFEVELCNYLELDGMQIRDDSFFDILTTEIKKSHPHLEGLLKELYLNKWFNSRLNVLGGMSPSEASQTKEGKQMLWSLIKTMYQNKNRNLRRGKRYNIKIKEYLSIIEEKAKKNDNL